MLYDRGAPLKKKNYVPASLIRNFKYTIENFLLLFEYMYQIVVQLVFKLNYFFISKKIVQFIDVFRFATVPYPLN